MVRALCVGCAHAHTQLTNPHNRLLDVPPDLPTAWLVTPRPEGTRCVVFASRGATLARRRDGSALVPHFPSQLPAGSGATAEAVESMTILDCILHTVRTACPWMWPLSADVAELNMPSACSQADRTFYILDAMCWRGYNMYVHVRASLVWCFASHRHGH